MATYFLFDIYNFLFRSNKNLYIKKNEPIHSSERASFLEVIRWWVVFFLDSITFTNSSHIFVAGVWTQTNSYFVFPIGLALTQMKLMSSASTLANAAPRMQFSRHLHMYALCTVKLASLASSRDSM